MKAIILYDNTALPNIESGWGFSCLVNEHTLFDTGEAPNPLFHNMSQLHVNPNKIERVVISHDHWDHTGGLWELLKHRKGLLVYACPGVSKRFKDRVKKLKGDLIEVRKFLKIDQNIAITGEIPGTYKGLYMPELALMLTTDRGLTVITGCSHTGIVIMVEKAKELYPDIPINLVFGGFHLLDKNRNTIQSVVKSMQELKVRNVGPTHCTGKEAQKIFKKSYGNNYIPLTAGRILEL